jgi:hypothetical protein
LWIAEQATKLCEIPAQSAQWIVCFGEEQTGESLPGRQYF